MSRLLEFGFGGISSETGEMEDIVDTVDIHDKSVPLVDRVAIALLLLGGVCCDDFLCSDEELTIAIRELEGDSSLH